MGELFQCSTCLARRAMRICISAVYTSLCKSIIGTVLRNGFLLRDNNHLPSHDTLPISENWEIWGNFTNACNLCHWIKHTIMKAFKWLSVSLIYVVSKQGALDPSLADSFVWAEDIGCMKKLGLCLPGRVPVWFLSYSIKRPSTKGNFVSFHLNVWNMCLWLCAFINWFFAWMRCNSICRRKQHID